MKKPRPYCKLFQNEIGTRKINAVITGIANQIFFSIMKPNQHYFLIIQVKFYGVQALRKG